MSGHNPFISILENLDANGVKFEHVLDKIIKGVVKIMNSTEELKEELMGYDGIYQTYVFDVNFNYWLEVLDGRLLYEKGVNPQALFTITFTKDLIIKILREEISGTDAFMKGKINVEGSLSQGLRYIKLFRIFEKYLRKKNGSK
ncbi:MAG TPA: SCP2 sterol-binding domain-containing protein [Candidatus Nanopelagicaceae bacterium]|nr:SCP2 sterol-binding domain-containing protein [Candidatus Nanopelagicaceae bacterium]